MANYEVKKGLTGYKVLYGCPACGVALSSPISKAGLTDSCPDCGKSHSIPGAKEKQDLENSAAKLERQKLEKRLRQQSEEARRRAEVAKRQADSAASPPVIVPPKLLKPAAETTQQRGKFGDSILDLAFTFARVISVVLITFGLFALTLVFILIATTYSSYSTVERTTIDLPTDADFNRHLELKRGVEGNNQASQQVEGARAESTEIDVFEKHGLTRNFDLYRSLVKQLSELDYIDQDACLRELDKFLTGKSNKQEAAQFFVVEYGTRAAELRDKLARTDAHNNSVTNRLRALSTSAAGVVAGLIGFMVLPLLIRIEANTRQPVVSRVPLPPGDVSSAAPTNVRNDGQLPVQ